MTEDIETDFETVYENGEVLLEENYHNKDRIENAGCGCTLTTDKGAYRDVVVEYDSYKYYFYHQTPVVVDLGNNYYILSNGGWSTETSWSTRTTRNRINKWTPSLIEVEHRDSDWYVKVGNEEREFSSGMVVSPE